MFKVRVIEYEVPGWPLNSFTHEVESSPAASDKWSGVMSYHSDDGFDIEAEQIHFVSNSIGYAFLANWYAVTVDGGESWTKHPFKEGWIREVSMRPNGRGSLKLEVYSVEENKEMIRFSTQDFGRRWSPEWNPEAK